MQGAVRLALYASARLRYRTATRCYRIALGGGAWAPPGSRIRPGRPLREGMANRVGQIDLCEQVGRGSTGTVWRGVHAPSGASVAVKVLHGEGVQVRDEHDLFRAEARAVASLSHPSIAGVYDFGMVEWEGEDRPYLVMEYVPGGSLSGRSGSLKWPTIRSVLLHLLDACSHAHARGVVHLDLKPGNVLVSPDFDTVKLTDFGIAMVLDRSSKEARERFQGTPLYMAPEQVERAWRDYGPWTDLYALGCLAWSLACGIPPFGRVRGVRKLLRAQRNDPLPKFLPVVSVPPEYETWARRLLSKAPRDRFQCAADAAHALLELDFDAQTEDASGESTLVFGGDAGPDLRAVTAPIPPRWVRPESGHVAPLAGLGLGLHGLRHIPMVGRADERDLLWRSLRSVSERGGPELVVLSGPSGVGKSRLARWLCERAHELGAARWMVARHEPSSGPDAALRDMVERFTGTEGLTRLEVMDRLHHRFPELHADCVETTAELVRPSFNSGLRMASTADRHAAVLRLLAHVTEEGAAVVWLDDVQWSSDTLAFAQHVLEDASVPLLMVATVRSDLLDARRAAARRVTDLVAREKTREIEIAPLSSADTLDFVERLLGLAPDLARSVAVRAEGNPLFAIHLLDDWIARDALCSGPEGLVLRDPGATRLPDAMNDVWRASIERVVASDPEPLGHALRVAACLGREVGADELGAALQDAALAARLADAMLDQGLAHARGPGRWAFAHDLLRDAIIARSNLDGDADALHRACAVGLAWLDDPPGGRIGLHLVAGGVTAAAVDALAEGAARHAAASRGQAAERLVALVTGLLAMDDPRRARAALLACRVARERVDLDALVRWSSAAVESASASKDSGLRAEAACEAALLARFRGDLSGMEIELATARGHLEGAPPELAARVELATGCLHADAGRSESAVRHLSAAWRLLEHSGDGRRRGEVRLQLGIIHGRALRSPAARALLGQALADFTDAGDPSGVGRTLQALGDLAQLDGRVADAGRCYEKAGTIFDRCGATARAVAAGLNLGLVELALGRHADAEPRLASAARHFENSDIPRWAIFPHTALLTAHAGLGDWGAWEARFRRVQRLLRDEQVADPDVARALERSADLASSADEPHRAARARALAAEQWRRLSPSQPSSAAG